MKTDNRLSRRIPASGVHDHKQPQWWLAPLSPFLKHVNMRTLALLMFFGVALLNTTDGKDAQTDKPTVGVTNTEPRDNDYQGASAAAPLILWQLTARIVHAFTAALNDPALIEYARQQGKDIPDLQTTSCQGAERKTSTY